MSDQWFNVGMSIERDAIDGKIAYRFGITIEADNQQMAFERLKAYVDVLANGATTEAQNEQK